MLVRSTIRLWRTRLFVLGLAGLLTACQHGGSAATTRAEGPSGTWSVVEQVGEVRMRAPAAVHWSPLAATRSLAAGTRVSTGAHASLILARAGSQLVAGPESEFALPTSDTLPLQQHTGTVRYRAQTAPWVSVQAGGLTLTAEQAVFIVAAGHEATSLEVEAGEVRVNTRDSTARRLQAGQRFVLPASMVPPPATLTAEADPYPSPSVERPAPVTATAGPQPAAPSSPFQTEPNVAPATLASLVQAAPGHDEPASAPAVVNDPAARVPGPEDPPAVEMVTARPGDAAPRSDDEPFARLVRGLLAGVAEVQFSPPSAPRTLAAF